MYLTLIHYCSVLIFFTFLVYRTVVRHLTFEPKMNAVDRMTPVISQWKGEAPKEKKTHIFASLTFIRIKNIYNSFNHQQNMKILYYKYYNTTLEKKNLGQVNINMIQMKRL